MSIQSGVPWTSESPDDLSTALGEHNDYQEDLQLAYPDETGTGGVASVAGIEPDEETGDVPLTAEALGIDLEAVLTPLDIGALADPGGGAVGQVPRLTNTTTRVMEFVPADAISDLTGGTLVEGAALFASPRKMLSRLPISSEVATAAAAAQRMQTGHNWAFAASTGGVLTEDTTVHTMGTQSLKIAPGIHASTLEYLTSPVLSSPVNLTTHALSFQIIRPHLGTGSLAALTVEVSSDGGTTWCAADANWWRANAINRWDYSNVNRGSFSITATNFGAVTWTAIDRIRIGSRTDAASGAAVPWWLQHVALRAMPAKGTIIFAAEARASLYEFFYVFQERGIPVNFGYRSEAHDTPGATGRMTTAQLQELCWIGGCDASPISYTFAGPDNASIGTAAMEVEIGKAIHWGIAKNLPIETGWRLTNNAWIAAANGYQDFADKYTNLSAMRNNTNNAISLGRPRHLLSHQLFGASTVANAAAYVDKVGANKGIGVIQIDGLTSGATSSGTISTANMISVIDDVIASSSDIDIKSLTQLMNEWRA